MRFFKDEKGKDMSRKQCKGHERGKRRGGGEGEILFFGNGKLHSRKGHRFSFGLSSSFDDE